MEFEIKGVNYRTAKLDVFQQLKVSRKLLPVLAGLVSEFSTLKAQAAAGNSGAVLESVLPKIADTLAALPDEDVNAVIYPCLDEGVRSGRTDVRRYGPVYHAAAGGAGGRRQPGKFFERTPRQRDAYPAIGPVLDSMPEGEDFLMRPVDAGLIPYTALKDGSVDLADIARMNDWLDLKADNENRIAKWREANER